MEQKTEPILLHNFDESEVSELQRYIETHVHNTILQKVYVLSDNPSDKCGNFVIVFRILKSCFHYASTDKLREKIDRLLNEAQKTYDEVYPYVLRYNNLKGEFGKTKIINAFIRILSDTEKNVIIQKIIDAFLVFGEKIELNRIDDYMGVDMEAEEGKEVMKELRNTIEKEGL